MSSVNDAPSLTRQVSWPRNIIAVGAITLILLIISQWWSGLDTPDSEFYASLAIFTDAITDRAPQDSYYWTRLGYITPVHVLISTVGIWTGFAAYKALLLLIITSSTFAIARQRITFWPATWLTAATASSSIVLAYLGNPYLTGTVLAGTAATIALVLRIAPRNDVSNATPNNITQRRIITPIITAITSGIVLGWIAMAYPSGALLAGVLWLGLFIFVARTQEMSRAAIVRTIIITALATIVTLIAFELSGRVLFPGKDWLGTYIEWASFDHSRYASGEWVWLRDISLLVPASVAVIAVLNRIRVKHSPAADTALIISLSSIGFFLTYAIFHGAQFLEAPMLQAMLWPPALIALLLVACSRMQSAELTTTGIPALIAGVIGLPIVIVAGQLDPNLPFLAGLVIAAITIAVVLAAPRTTVATIISITIFLTAAQLLQNSREALGQFPQDPYVWAYQANPNETKMRTAVNSQEWLIENTNADDQLLLWVEGPWTEGDRELYTVAAMQLWGENLLTLSAAIADEPTKERLNSIQPTALVLYGKSMESVIAFWQSIPAELRATAPLCYDYEWPIDPTSKFPTTVGHTCITRLNW